MLETLYRVRLEPDVGKIAVADCDPGARHQQAVDRGHQAAEQGVGGGQAKRSGIGHFCPLKDRAAVRCVLRDKLCIPDTRGNRFVCIAALVSLQCSKNGVIGDSNREKAAGTRRPWA